MKRLVVLSLTVFAGCGGGGGTSTGPDAGGGVDGAVFDAATTADAAPPDALPPPDAPSVSCEALPAKPTATLLPGFLGTEDIAFDAVGNVLESNEYNIFKTTRAGQRTIFVPNLEFRAGMRMDKVGRLFVNDDKTGTLWRIETNGTRKTLMTGLGYPNGMEIGRDGFVYFTDQNANRVYRVNPDTGENKVLTTGVLKPNGLTFNTTYDKLYIGSFGGTSDNAIYVLEMGANGTPGALSKFKSGIGTGYHDGMGVDACDNVYVADYGNATVYRINASDKSVTELLVGEMGGDMDYHANFDWGRGVGGWDKDKLYVLTVGKGIKELELGVPSKPRE